MVEFSEMFNRDEADDFLRDEFTKLKIRNMIQIQYYGLYRGLMDTNDPRFREIYKRDFGKEYTGLKDLKVIISEIERLKGKYKELDYKPEKPQGEKMSFERIILYVEMALNLPISRQSKLFEFKHSYDLAVKLSK